jgi:hypothetical protein
MILIDANIRPKSDASASHCRSTSNSQRVKLSVLRGYVDDVQRPQQQQRLVVFLMTILIGTIIINIPISNHYLVHSFSVVSTSSMQRLTNYDCNYNTRSIWIPQQKSTDFLTLLLQANTDINENGRNEASSSSSSSDDDSVTSNAPTLPTIIDRTSFDDAGRSLLDEQDMKRMNEMGDFDENPNVCTTM